MFKLFQSTPDSSEAATDIGTSGHSVDEIAEELRSLILQQLAHGGISSGCVTLEVHQTGTLRDGRHVFVGMMRLVKWHRSSAVRLLLGLPILESRLRRALKGTWMQHVSHFSGVWLHASGQLQDSSAMQDLRALVVDIERMESEPTTSMWSLPTELK
ncbi:hypothetical protein GCM10027034_18420 [Ramlibacter solisilvae]|uniref:Uncharacterized protein n=1 Tax=Ramlibacter tataouinensis TaxID=94132 RepID=A0A127JVV1_9BURK|nr:hypothetical protein [Ramlibacter tataouinensis]AMO24035.1 hypothetical protein UC35_15690 [Ramlibacter tataouinensis]